LPDAFGHGQKITFARYAPITARFNRVLDAHATRLAKVLDRLPTIVLVMLVFITAASVAVAGFNSGISGGMNRLRMTVLTLVLASIIVVIIDFDLPQRGFFRVSQETLQAVIRDMKADFSFLLTSPTCCKSRQ
jgi:hypothetical protein